MSRSLAMVEFEDGRKLYLIYDSTVCYAFRPLFETAKAAWDWYVGGKPDIPEPPNASSTELPVIVTTDVHFEGQEHWQYESRASADSMWLTGPRNFEERMDELSRDDGPCDGYYSS